MTESRVLLEGASPDGRAQAVVEDDGRTVYLYFMLGDNRMQPCWVRNLLPAPAQLDVASMREGNAPLLQADCCGHPTGGPPIAGGVRFVWFEEENGVALLENDRILAVVPAWADGQPCPGYAADCIKECSEAWPLQPDNELHERVRDAEEFWAAWSVEPSPWALLQKMELNAYESAFRGPLRYFATDGGKWPPSALAYIQHDDADIFLTVGMALRPQPGADGLEDASKWRRIELGVAFAERLSDADMRQVASYISAQTRFPWAQSTWLGQGHTLGCDSLPKSGNGNLFEYLVWTTDAPRLPRIVIPSFRSDTVTVLWGIPITASERSLAQSSGSKEVLDRLWQTGANDYRFKRRTAIA